MSKKSEKIDSSKVATELTHILKQSNPEDIVEALRNYIKKLGPKRTYYVTVWEHRSTYVKVKARDEEEALKIAEEKYENGSVKFKNSDIGDSGVEDPQLEEDDLPPDEEN